MEFLFSWGLFSVKLFTVAFCIIVVLAFVAALKKEGNSDKSDIKLKFTNLLKLREKRSDLIKDALKEADIRANDKDYQKSLKAELKANKKKKENAKEEHEEQIKDFENKGLFCPKRLFVIDFEGDTKATEVKALTDKINAILDVADENDEVIVNLETPGGVVNTYGLCSSQLQRLRDRGVKLTVCVDNVAASGGYLMACVANKIVAAPFAYIGSIGVVASIPNFNKVLKKHDVDYEQVTAGKYKRTLTMFGENTQEARDKFKNELELIHKNFKSVVSKYRPHIAIDDVATGEFWLASDALSRGLIDEIDTFDAYLDKTLNRTKLCAIKIDIEEKKKKGLKEIIKKFLKAETWVGAVHKEITDTNDIYRI
ncbi:MAG: protease SohB [Succinivibrio sp.]